MDQSSVLGLAQDSQRLRLAEVANRLIVIKGTLNRSEDQAILEGMAAAPTGLPCVGAADAFEHTP